jgi:hypothetical protein
LVNTADLLQAAINDAWHRGMINLPIDNDFGQKYPIIQYADDTLMIMPADMEQLMQLKNILQIFSSSTGLKVNYHKTTLVPINVDNDHDTTLANAFECNVETLPFAYLGLPLGIADLMPIVSRLDKKLSGICSLMSYIGRLTLLNSIINSLPMYAMCSQKIPITSFIHFEKSGRQFLWADKEDKIHGKCLGIHLKRIYNF